MFVLEVVGESEGESLAFEGVTVCDGEGGFEGDRRRVVGGVSGGHVVECFVVYGGVDVLRCMCGEERVEI